MGGRLRGISLLPALAWIWGAGSVGLALVFGAAIFRFQRLLRFAEPAQTAVSDMAAVVGRQLGLRRIPDILTVPVRLSPLVWAIGGRPRVVLPSELCQRLDCAALRTVLAHELAHIKRRDHVVRLLELVTKILYWWHPVTWWAASQLHELEEQCCDAVVLGTVPSGIKAYASAIVDTLDFLSEGPVTAPLAATAIRPSVSLARRIKMLQDNAPARRLRLGHLLLLAAVLAFPMALAVAVAAPNESDKSDAADESDPPEEESDDPFAGAEAVETESAPSSPLVGENAAGEKMLLEPVVGKNFIIMPVNTNLVRNRTPVRGCETLHLDQREGADQRQRHDAGLQRDQSPTPRQYSRFDLPRRFAGQGRLWAARPSAPRSQRWHRPQVGS